MEEYVRFMLGPVASKAVRTLIRPVSTIKEKPKQKPGQCREGKWYILCT
jgi:hypothetical protein